MKGSTNATRGPSDVAQNTSGVKIFDTSLQNATDSQPGIMSAADHKTLTDTKTKAEDTATKLSKTESRISTNEGDITTLKSDVSSAKSDISTLKSRAQILSGTSAPASSLGSNGDIYIKY